uniref:Fibronectin type-II domain-containing protein n=1 Tax=Capra hircus TaxID=9925 RepID=A0A8C2RRI9_CAPHI
MGNPVRWLSLALCLHGLKSDLIVRISPPFPVFHNYSCIFPFMYDDIIYYNCISVRSDYAWCSIDKIFQGRWRYCTAEGEHP